MRNAVGRLALLFSAVLATALPARATYHIMVIDEVFPGFEQAPDAQYVMLRMEAALQVFVHGQPFPTLDASGSSPGTFAMFCPINGGACNLPGVSPACKGVSKPCPAAIQGNDRRVLIATQRAQELFCITPDLLASGSLPYPSGRVCFGDCALNPQPPQCDSGPIDCVAYGDFMGANTPFGTAAESPPLGEALVGAPARQGQYSLSFTSAAVCVDGKNANRTCASPADCPSGTCMQCPQGTCATLLDNSAGFGFEMAAPQNYHGDLGGAGLAGDPEGTGKLEEEDIDAEANILFEANGSGVTGPLTRCALPAAQRGADANFDTHVTAADLIATIQIVTSQGHAQASKT